MSCQVFQDTSSRGSNRFSVICASQGCGWRMCVSKSRTKHSNGVWTINFAASCQQHSVLCLPTNPAMSVAQVASLPSVQNTLRDNSMTSVKTLLERVIERHGLKITPNKMKRAKNYALRATTSQASADLLLLGRLCEAFVIKNPGSRIIIEKTADNVMHRIFICPGQNDKAVPILLTNLHIDACLHL